MAIDYGWQNRTLIGYHAKDSNTFGVVQKELPILTKESEALFLLTRDQFFTISTPQISNVLTNYLKYQNFYNNLRLISNILLVPGLVIALGYLLRQIGLLNNLQIVVDFLSCGIADTLFGLSIFSVFFLWYDYYKDKSHPIRLPKAEKISLSDLEEIKAGGFKFGRYAHLEAINYINDASLDIICAHTNRNEINIYNFFLELVTLTQSKEIFKRANIEINSENLKEAEIDSKNLPIYSSTSIRSLVIYSLNEALLTLSRDIKPEHMLLALFNVFPSLKKFLTTQNSSIDILREVVRYHSYEFEKRISTNPFNLSTTYYRKGGIAESWIYGHTFILDKFSKNLNEYVAKYDDIFGIGHDQEIETLVSVLGKVSNKNALLVGEPGVGKSSLILGIAQKINRGEVPTQILDKRILQLDINGLIAFASKERNVEELVAKAVKELENAADAILYIDEMQELVPAKAQDSGHSLAGILLPYILNSKFPIIGTVNHSDYKKYFYSVESLRQTFTNIEVREISAADALVILETKINQLEKNFCIYITLPALISTVELAQRYIKEKKLPSSSVQLLESACSWAQSSGVSVLTDEHIAKVLSNQKGFAIAGVKAQDSTKLMQLEKNIKEKVIGQDDAVFAIVESLRRAHTDIRNPNRPIGAFLFMGPTGVGKTYLAKVVAEEYFGDVSEMIRIDMSEYQEISSIEKFLGESGQRDLVQQSAVSLIDKVKLNPYSVILFDEIEKAHPQILDLFLQMFDDGRLTSTLGEVVDFTHSIIVCTSNIGSKILLDSLSDSKTTWDEAKDRALIELRQSIKPELLNRFDKVIVFHPHDIDQLSQISEILLRELAKRLSEKSITLTWNNVIPQLIANKANQPGFGARPIKRYIQENIEGNIAKEMIEGQIDPGSEIEIKEGWII
ncbi:MAG: AAA family ATPase [Candidatus Dojkabacteria bacterium]